MKNIRTDLVIAVVALIVSGLAAGASWWQSRVVASQLSAQVWPYVSITNSLNADSVDVTLANDGLGPAIIRSIVVTVDGHPQRDVAAAVNLLIGSATIDPKRKLGWDSGTIGPGGVLRVGGTQTLLHVQSIDIARAAVPEFARLDVRACYCAIVVGNCWTKDERDEDPTPISACPKEANELMDPTQPELRRMFHSHVRRTG